MKSILILICLMMLLGSAFAEIDILGIRFYGWPNSDEQFYYIASSLTGELVITARREGPYSLLWTQRDGTFIEMLSIALGRSLSLSDGGIIGHSIPDRNRIYKVSSDHAVEWQYQLSDASLLDVYPILVDTNRFLIPYTTGSEDNERGKLDELSDAGQLLSSVEMQLERPHFLYQAFKLPDDTYLVQGVVPGTGFTCQVGENGETLWINYLEDNQQYSSAWRSPTFLLPDGTFLGRISNPNIVPGLEDLVWFNEDGDILRTVSFSDEYNPTIEAILPDGGILMSQGERLDAAGNLLYDMDYQAFADAIEDSLSNSVEIVLFNDVESTDNFLYYAVGYMYRYASPPPEEQFDAWLACAGPGPEPIRLSARKRAPEGTVDPGSPMRLRARVYNRGDVTQTVDIWTVARTPDWEVVGPIRMWSDVNIEPSEELAATLTQWVPEFAPPGDYNYILRVGDYPVHHYEAYFPFEVTDSPDARGSETRFDEQTGLPTGWEMLIELIERYPTTDDRWFATD